MVKPAGDAGGQVAGGAGDQQQADGLGRRPRSRRAIDGQATPSRPSGRPRLMNAKYARTSSEVRIGRAGGVVTGHDHAADALRARQHPLARRPRRRCRTGPRRTHQPAGLDDRAARDAGAGGAVDHRTAAPSGHPHPHRHVDRRVHVERGWPRRPSARRPCRRGAGRVMSMSVTPAANSTASTSPPRRSTASPPAATGEAQLTSGWPRCSVMVIAAGPLPSPDATATRTGVLALHDRHDARAGRAC